MADRLRNEEARAAAAGLAARGRGVIPRAAANEVRSDVVAAIADGDTASLEAFAAEAAASHLRGTAELARSAVDRLRTKEAAVSIRFIEPLDIPPPTQSQRDEQEKRAAALAVERQRVEREAAEREREQQELARLRGGGETSRQRAAKEYIQYLNGLQQGRWVPHGRRRLPGGPSWTTGAP